MNGALVTHPEMVYFMGLKVEVNTRTSFSHFSTASSSERPTTDSGGWLHEREPNVQRSSSNANTGFTFCGSAASCREYQSGL